MKEPQENPITDARTALAAAASAPDLAVRALYLGVARGSVEKAREALRELDLVLLARERELVHASRTGRDVQLALEGDGAIRREGT